MFHEKLGIYSLSKKLNDELLWAHYGNSHQGFCIEYELKILLEGFKHCFSVNYSKKPADIGISDVSDNTHIFKKIVGHKSSRWEYEQEVRILTDKFGINQYKFNALKSIYFGYRMNSNQKLEIMNRLKGRGVNYFQIEQLPNTYKFNAKPINDINESEITYLKQIPSKITGNIPVNFNITKQRYWTIGEKGDIEIELETVIKENELKWLAELIKDNLFNNSKLVIMLYYIKGKDRTIAWATTHFKDGKIDVNINELLENEH